MTHLNSSFLYNLSKQVPDGLVRRFILGGSDYSQYVTRWPTIRRTYDNIAPVTGTVNLANQDGAFNFFRSDKTKMIADAVFYIEASENRAVDVYSQNIIHGSQLLTNSEFWRPGSQVIRVDSATHAPDSSFTALALVSINAGASNEKYILNVNSADYGNRVTEMFSGNEYTVSAFFKYRETQFAYFNFSNADGKGFERLFDIQNGNIAGRGGVSLVETAGMEPHPGGWWRCWSRFDPSSGAGAGLSARLELGMSVSSGSTASSVVSGNGIYIWGPQLTITSTPVSYAPTGLWNRVFAADSFSNTDVWTPFHVTLTAGQSDPNGRSTAFLVQANSQAAIQHLVVTKANSGLIQLVQAFSNENLNVSMYAKFGYGAKYFNMRIRFNPGGQARIGRMYDIESGAVAGLNGPSSLINAIEPASSWIEDAGGGWWRCSMLLTPETFAACTTGTMVLSSYGTLNWGMHTNSFGGEEGFASTGSEFIYAWMPMAVNCTHTIPATATREYRANPPQLGRNLFLYSEMTDQGSWQKSQSFVVADYAKSPIDCRTVADLFVGNNGSPTASLRQQFVSATSGAYNALSMYVKLRDDVSTGMLSNWFQLREGANGNFAFFNIAVGSVSVLSTLSPAFIESANNGWWRITACTTWGGTFHMGLQVVGSNGTAPFLTTNSVHGCYVFGAMAYVASAGLTSAPPYVPTSTSVATVGISHNLIQACAVNSLHNVGSYEVFTGKVSRVKYDEGNITISITDKLKKLSERVMGSTDVPVSYLGSNYLPSDVAWWVITSYGNLSSVQSTTNPDIDYASFQEWSAAFSGDNIFVQARFEGTKVTAALRKIQRMTDSAIFLKNNKLSFRRFTIANSEFYSLDNDNVAGMELEIDETQIINRQYVFANYDVSSDIFATTVFIQDSASVNSFGLREEIEKDQSIWYTTSANAQNLAERIIFLRGRPYEKTGVDATLGGLLYEIGDMISLTDSLTGLSSSPFRVLDKGFNMDSCLTTFGATTNQSFNAFILDQSLLDGSAVLT